MNCLCAGHSADKCKSRPCKMCNEMHNTLIHVNMINNNESENKVTLSSFQSSNYTLLSTASINVNDVYDNKHEAKLLLDSGSQSNYITYAFLNKLRIQPETINMKVLGVNNTSTDINLKATITIFSKINEFKCSITCLVIPAITEQIPSYKLIIDDWGIPDDTILADPNFNVPSNIDILLGASHFWDCILNGQYSLGKNLPMLQNTKFGWLVSGTITQQSSKSLCYFSGTVNEFDLQQFWELESPQINSHTLINNECENYFTDTTFKNVDGRFVVRLPFKYSPNLLGDSLKLATKRFIYLENRFKKDLEFFNDYNKFITEYQNLGHMTLSSTNAYNDYYLPHHGVIKNDSLTTKLRVVFDGSAKTDSGWSLNDILHSGPNIMNNLFEILLRFRQFPIVVCADIEKMYRQILVHPNDRHFQKILWRNNPSENLLAYDLNTVTYGTS